MILCEANLHRITTASIPEYDRSRLTPGIVHIGLGNFHRAHQSWYLHRLMQRGCARDWAIIGAGVRPADQLMRSRLRAQDYLTTLVQLDPEQLSAEIVGSMIDFVAIEQNNQSLIGQLSDPAIRIVSLTITEGGYFVEPQSGRFDTGNPLIQQDADNPQQPQTAFGAIVAALAIRRQRGIAPFTCQSCDNLQSNGEVLRQAVTGLARMTDPGLADWIDQYSSFPNSMVDSIVAATGETELALVARLGIDDKAPVTHEPFRQWVTEDRFCSGRPPWEQVGVTLTDNVHDYETMKIRILNGGHQIIAAVGDLLAIRTISECMEHQLIAELFERTISEEVVAHIRAVPEYNQFEYLELIDRRFRNPAIQDTTRRVAFDGLSRQSAFIVPSIRDCLATGISPNGLALVSALWCRYCLGVREDSTVIEANDPQWSQLQQLAQQAKSKPEIWLDQLAIYSDIRSHPGFRKAFINWLEMLYQQGVESSLKSYSHSFEPAAVL